MEHLGLKREEKERSHDLLHAIFHSQHQEAYVSDLKAHRINQKYKVFQQRLHRSSKVNPFKHYPSLHHSSPFHHPLKQSHHLVKHQNKVEENIGLHRVEQKISNFNPKYPVSRSTLQSTHAIHADSYFTPKTREQIVGRQKMEIGGKFQHKKYNKQSNFSIQLVSEPIPIRKRPEELQWGLQTQLSPSLPSQDKENVRKAATNLEMSLSSPSFQTKCNSFSSFTHCPSRLYGKEKQELVSLDQHTPTNSNSSNKTNQISGFTRHELFSYYQSLLSFSGSSQGRYMTGFETMLNLMNITTNETTVKQLLTPFIADPSFQHFIDAFERIVESSLRESVVDYFQIVLDGKWTRELCFEELEQLLSERMNKYHAKEIVDEVYFQLERDNDQRVAVQDIVGLCYRSEDFCAFMRGYCQETQRQRVSLKPRNGKLLL